GSARPNVNLIGLEVAKKVAQLAAFRCLKSEAKNVRVLAADARRFLALVSDLSLTAVHIYFPDPWWKRRHRKRRIVAPDVLSQLRRTLRPGGRVLLATDVDEYFVAMHATFARFPDFARGPDPASKGSENERDY